MDLSEQKKLEAAYRQLLADMKTISDCVGDAKWKNFAAEAVSRAKTQMEPAVAHTCASCKTEISEEWFDIGAVPVGEHRWLCQECFRHHCEFEHY